MDVRGELGSTKQAIAARAQFFSSSDFTEPHARGYTYCLSLGCGRPSQNNGGYLYELRRTGEFSTLCSFPSSVGRAPPHPLSPWVPIETTAWKLRLWALPTNFPTFWAGARQPRWRAFTPIASELLFSCLWPRRLFEPEF